jgi:hypothetical protein
MRNDLFLCFDVTPLNSFLPLTQRGSQVFDLSLAADFSAGFAVFLQSVAVEAFRSSFPITYNHCMVVFIHQDSNVTKFCPVYIPDFNDQLVRFSAF